MKKNLELRQQMYELIQQWKESGLSQKTFCEQQGLAFFRFYYWYKRYRTESASTDSGNGSFVKLKIGKPSRKLCTEIYFPNGVHVVFNEPVSSDYLKKIVG
jgi:hypothetical protein